ncbi:zinc-ribbon domain containing protein [Xanthocytophaga agilis]|uniref:Zinc-ribbon domain containing protein n=1 Tax=Xanthocytophaga agilis TaxID=3048010 RepID=A0AAE3R4B8_9BACT|nr:zinc-ribbon domain containing protein [Xanthocytophaga agilis]MDJ1503651.1 zinc-ribbon domain containing protein [Xanthocytophaga agilis]
MDWACDECLQNGKAIKGDPTKQLFCHAPPHFAYFDKEKECRVCKETFVFTKSEQQYWYDHLNFWVQATRIYCLKCQSAKKQQDRISQLLNNFDYLDIEKLKEVVALYLTQGNYEKAKYHLTRGKKLRQRDSLEYINLDSWINEIKKIEKGKISAS